MKTILDNFERWVRADNGPAMAKQMRSLEQAVGYQISKFELDQIKAAVRIIIWTVENERLINGSK